MTVLQSPERDLTLIGSFNVSTPVSLTPRTSSSNESDESTTTRPETGRTLTTGSAQLVTGSQPTTTAQPVTGKMH